MNKKFFKDKITIYHFKDDETVMRLPFEAVYFRHNKKTNLIDKRTGKRKYRLNNNTYRRNT